MNRIILNLWLISIISIAIGGEALFSQESNKAFGGSPYSAFGIGMPQDYTSSNFKAQGILGITGITTDLTSLANPALWSRNFVTEGSTGLQLSQHNMNNGLSSESKTNLSPGYFHLLFPLYRGKLGVSFSLYPVTRANFEVLDIGSFESEGNEIAYANEVQSSGGVNKFEIGFGLKLTDNISFGYAPSVAFMTLNNIESLTFSSTNFVSQDQSSSITGTTISQRLGVVANFQKLLSSQDKISFGATLTLPYTISSNKDFTALKLVNNVGQSVDLNSSLSVTQGDIYIPLEASVGVGYSPSVFTNFSAEGLFQKWGAFTSEINPASELTMSDRFKVGVGGQFHPYRKNSNLFFSRFKYSGGLSYDSGHLTIQGNDISTLWINTGLGISGRNTLNSFPSIDISFQYGFRGTTNNSLIEERIWTLGFSVNLTERMFVRPKLR